MDSPTDEPFMFRGRPFSFFDDLPREIRDLIYEQCFRETSNIFILSPEDHRGSWATTTDVDTAANENDGSDTSIKISLQLRGGCIENKDKFARYGMMASFRAECDLTTKVVLRNDEQRLKIFKALMKVFYRKRQSPMQWTGSDSTHLVRMAVNLMRTCRQMQHEAYLILYGHNEFVLESRIALSGFVPRLNHHSTEAIQYLRCVTIDFRHLILPDKEESVLLRRLFDALSEASSLKRLKFCSFTTVAAPFLADKFPPPWVGSRTFCPAILAHTLFMHGYRWLKAVDARAPQTGRNWWKIIQFTNSIWYMWLRGLPLVNKTCDFKGKSARPHVSFAKKLFRRKLEGLLQTVGEDSDPKDHPLPEGLKRVIEKLGIENADH